MQCSVMYWIGHWTEAYSLVIEQPKLNRFTANVHLREDIIASHTGTGVWVRIISTWRKKGENKITQSCAAIMNFSFQYVNIILAIFKL